jgi:DNA-binding transcriptional MerR regulator
VTDDLLLTSDQVCAALGISYRQLNWWTSKGYLVPTVESTGTGNPRRWTLNDLVLVADFAQRVKNCPLTHGPTT